MPNESENAYPDRVIADRMEKKRLEMEMTVVEAARAAGFSHWSWYKKTSEAGFSVEQIGRFVARIGAPRGWPFIDWAEAIILEQALARGRSDRVHSEHETRSEGRADGSEIRRSQRTDAASGATPAHPVSRRSGGRRTGP